jgi:hypothetical protein
MRHLFALLFAFSTFTFAVDMPGDTEQFYVVQGLFETLNIIRKPCAQQDAVINFACGQFIGGVATFKQSLADYIRLELPGLSPATDWFNSSSSVAVDYRSSQGQYLFAYNPGGLVVVAFIPLQ